MIIWKQHSNEPVITNCLVLVKYNHYCFIDHKNKTEYLLRYFKRPFDEYPKKYNPDFYQVSSDELFWMDAKEEFEWAE